MSRRTSGLLIAVALISCRGDKATRDAAQADTTAFADSVRACEAAVSVATEPSLDTAVSTQDQERCAALLSRNVVRKYYPRAK